MGRKRTVSCLETHVRGESCRACGRLRARRFRAAHLAAERIRDQRRGIDPSRRARVHAYATIATALKRGLIVPPMHCDVCGREASLRPLIIDPAMPRTLGWLCHSCYRYAQHVPLDLELRWQWPGPPRPKMTRRKPRFEEPRHRLALTDALRQPRGTAQENAYVVSYFAGLSPAVQQAWIACGIAIGAAWSPTGIPMIDTLWRRYVDRYWLRLRREYEREHASQPLLYHHEPTVRASSPRTAPTRPTPPLPPSLQPVAHVSPDEALRTIERALADYDATVAAILARVDA